MLFLPVLLLFLVTSILNMKRKIKPFIFVANYIDLSNLFYQRDAFELFSKINSAILWLRGGDRYESLTETT